MDAFEILDRALFYQGAEKDALIRKLLRMDYSKAEAEKIFARWIEARGYTLESREHVVHWEIEP